MAITINDPELEDWLTRLGARQVVPVSKHRMAREMLRAARTEDRGAPVSAWRKPLREYVNRAIEPQPDVPADGVCSTPAEPK